MMKRWFYLSVSLSLLGVSCLSPLQRINRKHLDAVVKDRPVYSPWEIQEAKLLALFLSGSLEPEKSLYQRVLADIKEIRTRYGREERSDYGNYSLPEDLTQIRFNPPWEPSSLRVAFDKPTWETVAEQHYHAWDTLHGQLDKVAGHFHPAQREIELKFGKLLHPKKLALLHADLPGVVGVKVDEWESSRSRIYPRLVGEEIHYLFDKAWGDCREDCMYHTYWFFRSTRHRMVYEGFWSPQRKQEGPDWWQLASINKQQYDQM